MEPITLYRSNNGIFNFGKEKECIEYDAAMLINPVETFTVENFDYNILKCILNNEKREMYTLIYLIEYCNTEVSCNKYFQLWRITHDFNDKSSKFEKKEAAYYANTSEDNTLLIPISAGWVPFWEKVDIEPYPPLPAEFTEQAFLAYLKELFTTYNFLSGHDDVICPYCGSDVVEALQEPDVLYCMDCGKEFYKNQNILSKKAAKPMTYGDKIRSLTDEEIVDGILKCGNNLLEKLSYCKNMPECLETMKDWKEIPESMCKDCLREWVKSSYEQPKKHMWSIDELMNIKTPFTSIHDILDRDWRTLDFELQKYDKTKNEEELKRCKVLVFILQQIYHDKMYFCEIPNCIRNGSLFQELVVEQFPELNQIIFPSSKFSQG